MLYDRTVNVPDDVIRASASKCPIPSTCIIRRGLGEGAGMTRDVSRVLACPTVSLVSASTTAHSNLRTWPMSSAVGVYVLDRPTSNQVSPPLRWVMAAGYTGADPFVKLALDAEEDKVVLIDPDPELLNRPNNSSSSFPFSLPELAARSCKTRWCCQASEKHFGVQW